MERIRNEQIKEIMKIKGAISYDVQKNNCSDWSY